MEHIRSSKASQANTKLILLGTGNPNPNPNHSGPSLLILVGNTPYIVDFGAGLIRQAAALTQQYEGSITDFEISNIKTAFLTHLHSDHTIGYADLIFTPWVMGRDTPLQVYGPVGIIEMTKNMINAYREDIEYRVHGSEPIKNPSGWHVDAHQITEGLVYQDNNISAEAFFVNHGSMSNAFGYRFTTPDKIIVISGDTAPCENIIKYGQGSDILIHEVYYKKGFDKKSNDWKKYHAQHHTSTHQLAKIANKINPKLLVLTHTLFWGSTSADILEEISEIYQGNVVVGEDLDIFE